MVWFSTIGSRFYFYFAEPGYYEDGLFGIRIENQMIVTSVPTKYNFRDVGFLGFETTTYVSLSVQNIVLNFLFILRLIL